MNKIGKKHIIEILPRWSTGDPNPSSLVLEPTGTGFGGGYTGIVTVGQDNDFGDLGTELQ